MRKGITKKNVFGGKWVADAYTKKAYVKACNRKIRRIGKKITFNAE